MKAHTSIPSLLDLGKDKLKQNQLEIIFRYLFENIATASMVSEITGVCQKNICRYKRRLEKSGYLFEIVKKRCKKTGFKAWYLTTNPELAPNASRQLNLFADGR